MDQGIAPIVNRNSSLSDYVPGSQVRTASTHLLVGVYENKTLVPNNL
jgi:hypothetical protein